MRIPSSYAVGFDRMFNILDGFEKTSPQSFAYPPYDIIRLSENKYMIELAIAGVNRKDIEVFLTENVLTIKANPVNDPDFNGTFLYKGIATRAFTRTFALADTIEVKDITLNNGVLSILLENVIPEYKKPRKLEINSNGPQLLTESKNGTETRVLDPPI